MLTNGNVTCWTNCKQMQGYKYHQAFIIRQIMVWVDLVGACCIDATGLTGLAPNGIRAVDPSPLC